MSQTRLTYLFYRYINKEYTPEEKAELFRLIENGEGDEELKFIIDGMVTNTDAELHLPESAGDKILEAIIGNNAAEPVEMTVRHKRIIPAWLKIAAASMVLLGLFAFYFFNTGKAENAGAMVSRVETAKDGLLRITTNTGEGKSIILPDSTQIWLSPSSAIEYPEKFTGALREIKLSGEAFFEVAHDAAHPFIIHSGNIETKVLGTSFNIQAYDNQEEIKVTVVTGKVNVANTEKSEHVELVANQLAVFHRKTTALVKKDTDKEDAPVMLKRKEGEFVYKAERLQKVIDDLHEYFGITIIAADAIQECPVTFNFYLSEKIEGILEPIAISFNGTVSQRDNAFFIDGKACPEK